MLTVTNRGSKPRHKALHADCGKETIGQVAFATSTIRVFLPHALLPRAAFAFLNAFFQP